MKYLIFALICVFALNNSIPRFQKSNPHSPRIYKVSLDDSLQDRWRPIIKDYKKQLKRFMSKFDLLPLPEVLFDVLAWYARNIYKHKDFVSEVKILSNLSGYHFGKLFFLNWIYQYSTLKACSGIVVRNSEGVIFHGRNLDFQMWDLLARLVVVVDYYREGQLIYTVDTVVGSVFALTGIRYGAFSVNVNTRYGGKLFEILSQILVNDAMPDVWLVRKVLQEEETYQNALQRLKNTKIGAPIYFIISGIKFNEGAVIQRDHNGTNVIQTLNDTNWFLIHTNFDRGEKDPLHDPRRTGVQNRLRKYGNKNFNQTDLFQNFMTIWPTFNIATIMTAIMITSSGHHNTTVWYGTNPSGKQTPTF